MPPEFCLDDSQGDAGDAEMVDADADADRAPCLPPLPSVAAAALPTRKAPRADAREVPVLESVCPTWAYDVEHDAALIVFDQEATGTMMVRSTPRRIHNRDPVTARPIVADRVVWKSMLDQETGTPGHVFQLCKHGTIACRIEVTLNDNNNSKQAQPTLRRVAIVQASYTPLAVASGIADRSSLLVYDQPDAHLDSLREVHRSLRADAELGYAPVSECCVTAHFDRLSPCMPPSVDHTSSMEHQTARRAWVATKAFLRSMSSLTADCIDRYVETEIERTGTHELKHEYKLWRRALA